MPKAVLFASSPTSIIVDRFLSNVVVCLPSATARGAIHPSRGTGPMSGTTRAAGSEIRVNRGQCDEPASNERAGTCVACVKSIPRVNEPITTSPAATSSRCRFKSRTKSGTRLQIARLPGPSQSTEEPGRVLRDGSG
ncbi:hypothetical protein BKA58DRAFT_403186 [Alternaria rosae]|uniref:uncharacterized protein n=1 Tax=Alternaria rosae TaxID=1187941 RepID=UPI001E8D6416|nr:uncharacterized protein BKA58DRAFT_403186 [Alternaria rosae]KAH6866288.1 hypothetical protein BKA58DRAFT_403186 [Alternaria rosae]